MTNLCCVAIVTAFYIIITSQSLKEKEEKVKLFCIVGPLSLIINLKEHFARRCTEAVVDLMI